MPSVRLDALAFGRSPSHAGNRTQLWNWPKRPARSTSQPSLQLGQASVAAPHWSQRMSCPPFSRRGSTKAPSGWPRSRPSGRIGCGQRGRGRSRRPRRRSRAGRGRTARRGCRNAGLARPVQALEDHTVEPLNAAGRVSTKQTSQKPPLDWDRSNSSRSIAIRGVIKPHVEGAGRRRWQLIKCFLIVPRASCEWLRETPDVVQSISQHTMRRY